MIGARGSSTRPTGGAFDDPRSRIVIDDAKSYFASAHAPVRPHHVGAVESVGQRSLGPFHHRVLRPGRRYLTDDGVFGQWLHVYELDDALVLSVLAGLHQNFPVLRDLSGAGDLLVVASNRPRLPAPDWSVFGCPVAADLCRFRRCTPTVLDGLRIAGRTSCGPLLESYGQPIPTTIRCWISAPSGGGSVRTFAGRSSRPLRRMVQSAGVTQGAGRAAPGSEPMPAIPENPRVRAQALSALLRSPALPAERYRDRAAQPGRGVSLAAMAGHAVVQPAPRQLGALAGAGQAIDRLRNGGTAGIADEEFYSRLKRLWIGSTRHRWHETW